MSQQHPDIIDAKLTAVFFFEKEEGLGEIVKRISFFDFFKVQPNFEGEIHSFQFLHSTVS